jgi:hypothetical protein
VIVAAEKRWQRDVTTSHGHGTEKDEVQRSEKPTMMVRMMTRARGIYLLGSALAKDFTNALFACFSLPRIFGGYDHELWTDKRWGKLSNQTFREP